jgi:O-succinylbenzoate synthase
VELDRQKLLLQWQRSEADGKGDRKEVPGISAETLEQIEQELKLM